LVAGAGHRFPKQDTTDFLYLHTVPKENIVKSRSHAIVGLVSFAFIASFWTSTLVSELFLSQHAVASVKQAIVYAFAIFIPFIIATGATGFAMGGKSTNPRVAAKRRRMPFVALNGVLVMVPAALFLNAKAGAGEFDAWFYAIQVLELVAGAVNLSLIGLNIRDGIQLTGRFARPLGNSET
jgi:hypothetical protein